MHRAQFTPPRGVRGDTVAARRRTDARALVVAAHPASRHWLADRLVRHLGIVFAATAAEAIAAAQTDRRIALIVADLEDLDGEPIRLLWEFTRLAPTAMRVLITSPGSAAHRDAIAFVDPRDLVVDRPCSAGQLEAVLAHAVAHVEPPGPVLAHGVAVPPDLPAIVEAAVTADQLVTCWYVDVSHARRAIGEAAWRAGAAELAEDAIYRTTVDLFGGTVEVLAALEHLGGKALIVAHRPRQVEPDECAWRLQIALDAALLPVVARRHDGLPRASVAVARLAAGRPSPASIGAAVAAARAAAAERARRALDADRGLLLQAMEGGLAFAFQPLVDLETTEVYGYEALLRGPTMSPFRAPSSMVALASEVGARSDLDEAAVIDAMTAAVDLDPRRRLFINMSTQVLLERTRMDRAARWSAAMGLVPAQVVFEIESLEPFRDGADVRRAFEPFAARGFSLAVDRVGTGAITLRDLEALHPDVIKVPAALVRGVAASHARQAMIAGLVRIAREMDASVVAAGVEDVDDLARLRDLGLRYAQGFLIGEPRRGFGGIRQVALDALFGVGIAAPRRAAAEPPRPARFPEGTRRITLPLPVGDEPDED